MKQHAHRRAFTLIELLIVIAIIGILVAMLLPVVSESLKSAEVAKAQSEVNAIKASIDAFYSIYGRLPGGSGSTDIIKSLIAEDSTDNPKEIVFLEIATGDITGTFEDPWGKQYNIKLDDDYDNAVTHTGRTFKVTSVVYSDGIDGASQTEDDVNSFD